MKYLPLYFKWMETGKLPGESGLCKAFKEVGLGYDHLQNKFAANKTDAQQLCHYMWYDERMGEFTEIRQNIILLMAAMNNEL